MMEGENSMEAVKHPLEESEHPLGEIDLSEAPRQALDRYKAVWEEKHRGWSRYSG